MSRKVLIVGIDGGSWSVLNPAMDHGHMPHLKRLIESGCSGILKSTIPPKTPAAWGTFQTGVNPGKNGVFDFSYWDRADKRMHYVSSKSLRTTIWQMASAAGKRVGVLNVPMTYPPSEVNGFMITGILTPSIEADFTYPPDFKTELLKAVPGYHIFNLGNIKKEFMYTEFESLVERIVSILDSRTKAAEFVINKGPLDLFMVHFQANDVLQHMLWGYLDEDHPLYDQAKREYIFDRYYRYLDSRINHIRQIFKNAAGDDYLTVIVSDHGFETHYKRFNLGNWLCREGFLKLNTAPKKLPLLKKITKGLGVGKILRRFLSPDTISRMERAARITGERFIWEQSRAFSVSRGADGFIYLLEEDESKRKKTVSSLIEKLTSIRDPETNTAIVKAVYRSEEIYHGGLLEVMPDIVVEPESGYSFTGDYQPDEGLFHKVCPGSDFHIGRHHRDGIIIAVGKDIRPQKSVKAQLIDIVPSLAYYLQLPISSDIDGRVIYEMFTKDFIDQNQIQERTSGDFKAQNSQRQVYSEQDESKIRKRLEELGYM